MGYWYWFLGILCGLASVSGIMSLLQALYGFWVKTKFDIPDTLASAALLILCICGFFVSYLLFVTCPLPK